VVYVIVVTINLVVMMVDSLISEDGGMEGWRDGGTMHWEMEPLINGFWINRERKVGY